jgi:hypothetical protein
VTQAGGYSIELCRRGGFVLGVADVIASDDNLTHALELYWRFVAANPGRVVFPLRPCMPAGAERPARRDGRACLLRWPYWIGPLSRSNVGVKPRGIRGRSPSVGSLHRGHGIPGSPHRQALG